MEKKIQIKDISNSKVATTLVKSEKELVNHETGEIISRENTRVTKEKNREKFIKIFIDNLDYIIEALKPIEKSIFFILMQQMNYHNVIAINSTIRKTAQIGLNLSQPAVSKGINALIEKRVLIKIDEDKAENFGVSYYTGKEYLVNPQLIGSGSFKELSQIRRVITTTYDFNKLETTKEIKSAYAYSGFEEVEENLDKHEIKQITSEVSPDGRSRETEILIGEKNNDDVIDVEAGVAESKKSDVEIENENLRLKIKALELEKVNKELENAKLDKEIELTKLQRGAQPSLNFGDDNK